MKRTVLIAVVIAAFIFTPNLIWLVSSTTRITNAGANTLKSVIVHIDDKATNLGALLPGTSHFMLLPEAGDATYMISYVNGSRTESVCQEYVEGDMYHVETQLADTQGGTCTATLPLASELFILKVL